MNGRNDGKLKKLLDNVPSGYLVDSAWMSKRAIAKQSVHDYVGRGWLERVAHGVYRRPFTVNTRPQMLPADGKSRSSPHNGSWAMISMSAELARSRFSA